jgi:L-asparaginase
MLQRLRLEDVSVNVIELMSKDSLHMTDDDRARVIDALRAAGVGSAQPSARVCDGVVILHGTDTLTITGEAICRSLPDIGVHIVLTGAMRPYEMKRSDALQNLTEAIFAAGLLSESKITGVFCVAHGRALRFPGIRKDRDRGTFVKASDTDDSPEDPRSS